MGKQTASTPGPHILGVKPTDPIVLCVGDDEVLLALLRETLAVSGVRVVCECDTVRARRIIRSMEIDGVVLDYDMPGCNGLELAETFRFKKSQVPILIFSRASLFGNAQKILPSSVGKRKAVLALVNALQRELI